MRALLSILSFVALPAAAVQACPTSTDLSTGFTVEFDDGASEYYLALRDDLVRMEQSFDGDITAVMDLGLGVFVLSYMDVYDGRPDPSTRITTSYPEGIASLRVPETGARWSEVTVGLNMLDGPFEETVIVAWGSAGQLQIGGCDYTAIPGIVAYQSENTYSEGITYLPELGVGFVSWYEDGEGRYEYGAMNIRAGR